MIMLRHFVYTAIVEDCLALLETADQEGGLFRRIRNNDDFTHLGNISDMDNRSMSLVMDNMMDNKRTGYEEDEMLQKEAYLFGLLCRKATVLHQVLATEDDEAALYQDCGIFREYYSENMRCAEGMTAVELERLGLTGEEALRQMSALLRILFKRAIVRTHTFKPGYQDIQTWLTRFYNKQVHYEANLDVYASTIIEPEAEKMKEHIIDPVFFDSNDHVIRMAHALRDGKPVSADEIEAALAENPKSVYGQAVKSACELLSDYDKALLSDTAYKTFSSALDSRLAG